MRFTKNQVAAEKARAVSQVRSSVRRHSFLKFLLGALVGAASMYAVLKPEDVKKGYDYSRQWLSKESVKVKEDSKEINADVVVHYNATTQSVEHLLHKKAATQPTTEPTTQN